MLEVVADPVLVAGWLPRRLDAPDDDALVIEGPKGVVDPPSRDGPDLGRTTASASSLVLSGRTDTAR